MSINIYAVANHLSEYKWKLISDSYKNLNTELEMECPKGHKQKVSYGKWRKNPICEICMAGETNKFQKDIVPEKEENTQRILALDAATNVSGYSIYDNGILVSYGVFKTPQDLSTTGRIHEVKKWLQQMIDQHHPDVIGLENIQLQEFSKGRFQVELYRALAQLQGVLLDVIFENCIDHDLVYSGVWRKYCGINEGTGRENKKKAAQDKVKTWYNIDCTQDEADAICIGKYFCSVFKSSHSSWGEDIE